MNSVGIDIASKLVSYYSILEGKHRARDVIIVGDDIAANLYWLYVRYTPLMRKWAKAGAAIYVEEPMLVSARGAYRSFVPLVQVYGVLSLVAKQQGTEIHRAPISSWKKSVVGNGRADKPAIAEWLRANRPDMYAVTGSEHTRDAACIALYGRMMTTNAG